VFIEVGPTAVAIEVKKNGEPCSFDQAEIERYIAKVLSDVGEYLPVLKQRAHKIRNTAHLPHVARSMVDAAKRVGEGALTPMAAVAGAVADSITAYLATREIDFASVNNGGDISVLNRDGRALHIGIGDISKNSITPYRLVVKGLASFGMATSGFGGRSFTLGIADAATVVADSGAVADAAATYVGNATSVDSWLVARRKAAEIDPDTDIPDEMVTVRVGKLDGDLIREALSRGLNAALKLKEAGIILDAVLMLRGEMVTTIGKDQDTITLEVLNGD
jgi:ApbE superfamily uncharacterized protein (UPF0280 family)